MASAMTNLGHRISMPADWLNDAGAGRPQANRSSFGRPAASPLLTAFQSHVALETISRHARAPSPRHPRPLQRDNSFSA